MFEILGIALFMLMWKMFEWTVWLCCFAFKVLAIMLMLPFKLAWMLIKSLWNSATRR